MALIADKFNLYTSVSDHDYKIESCVSWTDHYNFMASIPWNTKEETEIFLHEKSDYLCYDV
jgi:sensor domain CHASE-containing protein